MGRRARRVVLGGGGPLGGFACAAHRTDAGLEVRAGDAIEITLPRRRTARSTGSG